MKKLTPLFFFILWVVAFPVLGDDEFSFDLKETQKNPFEWGGYSELKWEHMDVNRGSSPGILRWKGDSPSDQNRLTGTLAFNGSWTGSGYGFHWLLMGFASEDNAGWTDNADIYEAYATVSPTATSLLSLGKKSYKWGKGYAWNPAGFINRRKDPNNPDESREGYSVVELDLVKSYSSTLQTLALTTVLLPVAGELNDDFASSEDINLAMKLYMLVMDTDIDMILFAGDSRPDSFGVDFSKNLAENLEIHGEFSWTIDQSRTALGVNDALKTEETDTWSSLIGLRHLNENNLTTIIEYYHNDSGYSEEEMATFYRLLDRADREISGSATSSLMDLSRKASLSGYGQSQPGRNYLYVRLNQKEPFDLLYFSAALTAIANLDDLSYSITPELVYTGITNWELRVRWSYLQGDDLTEFSEKLNSNKLELRLCWFF